MPAATELSDRQIQALGAVKDNQPCTAKQVADAIDGADARGWAQTIRRMDSYIERTEEGYRLTNSGKAKIRRIRLAAEQALAQSMAGE